MSLAKVKSVLGLSSPESLYNHFWSSQGFVARGRDLTPSIQGAMRDPTTRKRFEGFLARGVKSMMDRMEAKQVTSTTVASAIPLVFDPEVLDIMRTDAPLLARLPMRGYAGDPIRVNPISTRDPPVGFVSEAASLNLLGQSRGFTLDPIDFDQKIYADVVTIGDFAERVSVEGPINLRETALGARLSEWAQHKEQAVLYGDHSQGLTDGSPGDANAYDGLCVQYTIPTDNTASNVVDKSAVDLSASDALLKDIKHEIKNILMTRGVSKGDLEIWTSHTLFDELENELQVRAILDQNVNSANYGYEVITISGVPVIGGHNVCEHTWKDSDNTTYTVGSEGDVFINNMRATAFAGVAPLFMIPLGRQGLADDVALGEYGTLIDRAGGRFGKYLQNYNI